MTLTVRTFRGMSIDISQVSLGDILVVSSVRGRGIKLLPVMQRCTRRWVYAKSSWLPGDKRQVENLIAKNSSITALDGYGSIDNGSIDIFVPLQFCMDMPLPCEVEINWESDAKGRSRSRSLGSFVSTGGDVVSVTPGVISRS
ncbi:MAG: hypothetical protein JWQ44_2963 [Chthoniobacter sp.]|nr:hypothetical protein [Chthoniobacter sp.]